MPDLPERPDQASLASASGIKRAADAFRAPGKAGRAWRAAMIVAALSDIASVFWHFVPPVQITIDLGTALVLAICLRWRWPFLLALIPEAFPGTAMLPFWVLVIAGLAALNKETSDG